MKTLLAVAASAVVALALVGCGGGRSAACTKALNCHGAVHTATDAESSVKTCELLGGNEADSCCNGLTDAAKLKATADGGVAPAACN